jgi:hypothetical protein
MTSNCAALLVVGLCTLGPLFAKAAQSSDLPSLADSPIPECRQLKDYPVFTFEGQRLEETPDIENPDLRHANLAISARCLNWTAAFLDGFTADHPEEYHVQFLKARFQWLTQGAAGAQVMLRVVLQRHPNFTSAKVLLGSIALDSQDVSTASKLLDEVSKEQPTDLWAFIDRLRLEALVAPSPELLTTLRSITRDERFPPSARQQAAITARYSVPNAPQEARDAAFADQMKAKPADPDCVLAQQAMDVIELRSDSAAGIRLIKKYTDGSPCAASPLVKTLLAEAYLLEAAKRASIPTKKNAKYITQARQVLDNDLTSVAQRLAYNPLLNGLLPLISDAIDPTETFHGYTLACNAIFGLNPPVLALALDRGASASSTCENETLMHRLLFMATQSKVPERQAILRLLLEHGAPAEGLDFCSQPGNGDCPQVLLPILQEFASN